MDNISKTCLLPIYLLHLPTQNEEFGVHELFLSSCPTVTTCTFTEGSSSLRWYRIREISFLPSRIFCQVKPVFLLSLPYHCRRNLSFESK